MRKNFSFDIKYIPWIVMCLAIVIAASITTNCKLKTNNFINNYEAKLDSLTSEVNDLKEDNSKLETEVSQLKNEVSSIQYLAINNSDEEKINDTNNITNLSGLTANELNNLINKMLTDNGYDYNSSAMYNIGSDLALLESAYHINALYALSVISLETGYGYSAYAKDYNNLFGIYYNGEIKHFESISESIDYFGQIMKIYYISDGLVSVNKIGEKYCPNNTEWISVVNSIWSDFNKKLH